MQPGPGIFHWSFGSMLGFAQLQRVPGLSAWAGPTSRRPPVEMTASAAPRRWRGPNTCNPTLTRRGLDAQDARQRLPFLPIQVRGGDVDGILLDAILDARARPSSNAPNGSSFAA